MTSQQVGMIREAREEITKARNGVPAGPAYGRVIVGLTKAEQALDAILHNDRSLRLQEHFWRKRRGLYVHREHPDLEIRHIDEREVKRLHYQARSGRVPNSAYVAVVGDKVVGIDANLYELAAHLDMAAVEAAERRRERSAANAQKGKRGKGKHVRAA